MDKTRKIPLRKCVVTQERLPKQALIRIVKNNQGDVFVDPTGKQNGRGAYLKKSLSVLEKAIKTKRLERHLDTPIDDAVYAAVRQIIEDES
ncbi:MAG: YlxR family protein [Acholeplasmatales bacterium]|nr:MAG: YlxR family protein [Acholeplasmatales bacterium]